MWAVLGRTRTEESGQRWQDRMSIPLRCGHRACPVCGDAARGRASSRMAGDWKSTLTLTVPTGRTRDYLWREMGGWLSRWTAAYKKWLARHRPGASAHYAWVLENHYSGYPHVHLVLEFDVRSPKPQWLEFFHWVRASWREICGLKTKWGHISPIRSTGEKLKNYMLKYLTKASYDVRHYVIIGKNRMWATSVKAQSVGSKGWVLENVQSYDLIGRDFELPPENTSLVFQGFTIVWRSSSAYLATKPLVQSLYDIWPTGPPVSQLECNEI